MADFESMSPKELEKYNASRFVWSNGLQGIGDQIVSAKTVLPWLFQSAGVPGFFAALLVPIRESGSMLPQAALSDWVTSRPSRKNMWILGSTIQGVAALLIGLSAFFLKGVALGIAVVLLLSVLALARALCSITSKDVQGETISKGRRGWVSGRAAAFGGGVTLVVGLGIALTHQDLPGWALACLMVAGACAWLVASAIFRTIHTPEHPVAHKDINRGWLRSCIQLLTEDKDFRKFVVVRSLLLVTSLSTAFIVTLAHSLGHSAGSLGFFITASGLAGLLGGRISGVWSDASSKRVMSWCSFAASVVLVGVVAAAHFLPMSANAFVLPLGFFLINLFHTGVRVARKTYIVDMAEGDQRTRYVGAANSLMGLILLATGAISGVIAEFGPSAALLFLATMGFIGCAMATQLKEVSAGREK